MGVEEHVGFGTEGESWINVGGGDGDTHHKARVVCAVHSAAVTRDDRVVSLVIKIVLFCGVRTVGIRSMVLHSNND